MPARRNASKVARGSKRLDMHAIPRALILFRHADVAFRTAIARGFTLSIMNLYESSF